MIFPNLNLWTAAGASSAAETIDRSLQNRQHRLIAGVSLDRSFQSVSGCLAVVKGQGKFAKLQYASGDQQPVPEAIRAVCIATSQQASTDLTEVLPVLRDLAEVQASVIETLKIQAGKYVDRVLAVALTDPGFWTTDFDGRPSCQSVCDPLAVAEIAGVNVIDALPERDLLVGGSGRLLSALPIWILLADRSPRIARMDNVLIDATCCPSQIFWLPASDGLDAELPKIDWRTVPEGQTITQTITDVSAASKNQRVVIAGCPSDQKATLEGSAVDSIQFLDEIIGADVSLAALTSALLGMFHIDQMPANVPSLTGAHSQRILGRLTPGRPSNWRHLIRVMAQHQPAPMKLKDAV